MPFLWEGEIPGAGDTFPPLDRGSRSQIALVLYMTSYRLCSQLPRSYSLVSALLVGSPNLHLRRTEKPNFPLVSGEDPPERVGRRGCIIGESGSPRCSFRLTSSSRFVRIHGTKVRPETSFSFPPSLPMPLSTSVVDVETRGRSLGPPGGSGGLTPRPHPLSKR